MHREDRRHLAPGRAAPADDGEPLRDEEAEVQGDLLGHDVPDDDGAPADAERAEGGEEGGGADGVEGEIDRAVAMGEGGGGIDHDLVRAEGEERIDVAIGADDGDDLGA